MKISLHDIDTLLNAYNKQKRKKDDDGKSTERAVDDNEETVIDQVMLSEDRIKKTDTPDQISQKLIETLLKDEKKNNS
jgi:hypothetical protein